MVVKLSYEVNQNHSVFLFDPHNTNVPKYKKYGNNHNLILIFHAVLIFYQKLFLFQFCKTDSRILYILCKIAPILHTTTQEQWCNLKLIFLKKPKSFRCNYHINPFQPSVAFHIETCHLICSANQMTGLYIKCNTGLKWTKVT